MHLAPPVFEKARSYLGLQLHEPKLPVNRSAAATAPFVTISRESGSGGSSLARLLAARLNPQAAASDELQTWTVFDQEVVERMLQSQQMPASLARFMPEDKIAEFTATVGEIVGLHPSLWDLVRDTNRYLRELARRGHTILVGRGANFAAAGLPNGIHVRLTASAEHRAHHMARILHLSLREAAAHNRRIDAARNSYVRRVFDRDVADPHAYDLVINTGRVGLDQAAATIAALVTARSPETASAQAV